MNSYIIFRLGIDTPTQEEFELILRISEEEPTGGPIFPEQPGLSGVMTLIKTGYSAQEITEMFQEMSCGIESKRSDGNVYPVMVFKVDPDNFKWNQDMHGFLNWGKRFEKLVGTERQTGTKQIWTLDDLLDIMNQRGGGLDVLNEEEKASFMKLSQEL